MAISVGRLTVIYIAMAYITKAIPIAVRYAATREQFGPIDGQELPIIEYQLVVSWYNIKSKKELEFVIDVDSKELLSLENIYSKVYAKFVIMGSSLWSNVSVRLDLDIRGLKQEKGSYSVKILNARKSLVSLSKKISIFIEKNVQINTSSIIIKVTKK